MRFISSDILNPMLVRDLRQGLRASMFTTVFVGMQLCLAFFVVVALLSGQGEELNNMLEQGLEFAVVFFFILILPLTGAMALSPEFRENRIDLLKLTQMSARSLVWGKWLSLFVQGLLVITSLLPYMILTYFLGGVNLTQMFEGLVIVLCVSALLVGVTVAFSCFNSMVLRVLMALGLLWMMGALMGIIGAIGPRGGMRMFGFIGGSGGGFGVVMALFLAVGIPALWLFLEFGAFRLAPSAENHDTPQRLIVLGLAAVGGVALILDVFFRTTFLDIFTGAFFAFSGFLGVWVMIFATANDPSPYPDTYRPFVRFGAPGRFIGRIFLYPGWPSSAPFIMLASAFFAMLVVAMASRRGATIDYSDFGGFILLPPAVLFPQVLGWLVLGRSRYSPGVRYFVAFGLCMSVWIVMGILSAAFNNPWLVAVTAIFPPDGWALLSTRQMANTPQEPVMWTLVGISSAVTIGIIWIRALRHWEKFTALEQRAESLVIVRERPSLPSGLEKTSPPEEKADAN